MSIVFKIENPRIPAPGDGVAADPLNTGADRFRHLIGSEDFSDAVFLVGPEKETAEKIPVHSFLLRLASEVFDTMFSENWKKDEPIHIPDCDSDTMYSLLRWIYCIELIVVEGKLIDLLRQAHKYMISPLLKFVTENFTKVDKKITWSMLSFALEFSQPELAEKCVNLIKGEVIDYLQAEDFLTASPEAVEAIVSIGDLKIFEVDLFKRLLQWAENECKQNNQEVSPKNQRKTMSSFIHEIGFPGMEVQEFSQLPCLSGILTHEEQAVIFQSICGVQIETKFRKAARKAALCRFWKKGEKANMYYCGSCQRFACPDCYNLGVKLPHVNPKGGLCSNAVWHQVGTYSRENCHGKMWSL
jgi:hypothetical protein